MFPKAGHGQLWVKWPAERSGLNSQTDPHMGCKNAEDRKFSRSGNSWGLFAALNTSSSSYHVHDFRPKVFPYCCCLLTVLPKFR